MVKNVLIMGAAGRDFHDYNTLFRNSREVRVVAFTATQIPLIENRIYPPELAGKRYPEGIPIFAEAQLPELIHRLKVDQVVFAYSDISYADLMHRAALVQACGADFKIPGTRSTMLASKRPVVAVCAVRTGCGKSSTTRHVCRVLQQLGKRFVIVRHPMPYGDLRKQRVQRFSRYEDFDLHRCTIEEREEYEPLVEEGFIVYAGVDYAAILKEAETEAEVIIWDGGNNDTPFFRPDVHITLLDPHRAGHETLYYPGETNLRMADIAIINKIDSAGLEKVEQVRRQVEAINPGATLLLADSKVELEQGKNIRGKRVLVVEDGPSLTHGGMPFGAGVVAAREHGAAQIVDPRPYACGAIRDTYQHYPHLQRALPAMGYSKEQIADLEATITRADCDLVLFATPIDLRRLIRIDKPSLRVRYRYSDHGDPTLSEALKARLEPVLALAEEADK
ncbi:Predicted GTPase [Malonomonas rubra DSM 5091]|uniref:Predicted GTPase n=1 Tax=Malonomonas rubra DSM 5091 TaxID=1122189 RepID=A0A1M6LYH6_MALRU|nr:cyclic 2,3-diphosphoglycerate synthase [Malonomonas rubra]SHJ76246.1 Predicted GTPase [Malonomonas rubra DSM 5091]